jgi:hypothetical protein
MNPVRPGYRRLHRLEKGVWLYRCLRCGNDVRSTGTGAHEAMHKRRNEQGASAFLDAAMAKARNSR